MKASELRIQNTIENSFNLYCQVEDIAKSQVEPDRVIITDEEEQEHYIEECLPIMLNRDRMLKLGFKQTGSVLRKGKLRWIDKGLPKGATGHGSYFMYGSSTLPHVTHYLHQVQNLYFALTREELSFEI